MESHRSSRTLSPGQHAIPSVEDSPGMEADEAEPGLSIIGYCLKTQQQADISAPVAGTGRTLRFRGSFLLNIGKMFPCSDVCVHRIGDPVESDFEVKGTVLYGMRSVFDAQPIYRITLSKCDIANENGILWNLQDSGHGFTADDYCNLLELGKDYLGDLMMLAINMRGMRCWYVPNDLTIRPSKLILLQEDHSTDPRKTLQL